MLPGRLRCSAEREVRKRLKTLRDRRIVPADEPPASGDPPTATPGVKATDRCSERGTAMGYMFILLIIWGVFLACLLGLLAYNATLTRYEEDQLFLSESSEFEKQHQSEIIAKLKKTQPFVRIFGS